jgi:hypothetical protein
MPLRHIATDSRFDDPETELQVIVLLLLLILVQGGEKY